MCSSSGCNGSEQFAYPSFVNWRFHKKESKLRKTNEENWSKKKVRPGDTVGKSFGGWLECSGEADRAGS